MAMTTPARLRSFPAAYRRPMLTTALRTVLAATLLPACALPLFAENAADTGKVAAGSAWLTLDAKAREGVEQLAGNFKDYLRVAKSAALSDAELMRQAKAAGFTLFTSPAQIRPGAKLIFDDRGRSLVLAVIGSDPVESGTRVIAAHQDSPHINLKSRPVINAPGSIALFKTTDYGGIKRYQWSNLPLALVGQINTSDGRHIEVNIGFAPGDPVFVIPDNAPHSDKPLRTRTYADVLSGEEMDPVAGSIPGEHDTVADQVMAALRQRFHIKDEDLVSAELELVPATEPADVGIDRGLIGSWGQDDKLSAFSAVHSLLGVTGTPRLTAIAYITNFEEVGSVNNTGARSEFLSDVYAELLGAEASGRVDADLALRHALRHADVLSADTNDGINPLFGAATSEPSNAAIVGYGVSIKRYGAGFDPNSEFTARIIALLDQNQIAWQTQTPKVDVGGGGTIGGFLSQRSMEVIDVGIPLLSMHATYEMSSKVDLWSYNRFFSAFYQMN
jgi:aspartyl aminopeptidase